MCDNPETYPTDLGDICFDCDDITYRSLEEKKKTL